MPNVNNHSQKFKKAQQNFTRLESIKADVSILEDLCQESLAAHNSKKNLTKKRSKEITVQSKLTKARIIEKVDAVQKDTSVVAGTGDLTWVNKQLNRVCDVEADGTFDTTSLLTKPVTSVRTPTVVPRQKYTRKAKGKRALEQSPSLADLIPPSNGTQYNPPSLLRAVKSVPSRWRRRMCVKAIEKGLIPYTSMRSVNRLFAQEENGEPIPAKFGERGRPVGIQLKPLFGKIEEQLTSDGDGATATNLMINSCIDAVQSEAHQNDPTQHGILKRMSNRSKQRYRNLVKQVVPGRATVRKKNTSRQAAEQSIRSVVTFLHTICATHFRLDPNGIGDKSIKHATDGSNETYMLVCEFHGGLALCVVPPDLICSTDDSAIFTSRYLASGKVEWHYIFDIRRSSKKSYFTTFAESVANGFKSGITFRYTATMQASGGSFPVSLQLLHLTERELPKSLCPSGILLVRVPGLCIGSGQDIRNDSDGFVTFVRQGTDEALIYHHYIIHVFLPHLKLIRKKLGYVKTDANTLQKSQMSSLLCPGWMVVCRS